MKIVVCGNGRWGSFIAWYLDRIGMDVSLYGRNSEKIKKLEQDKKNDMLQFSDKMKFISDLEYVREADIIIIAISAQHLQSFMENIVKYDIENKIIVLCMKGIDIESGRRLSEIVIDSTSKSQRVAVWLGPGHPQEFAKGVPNCMVIDSENETVKNDLVRLFTSDLIRFYKGVDLVGNEIGAASKNVIGVAAGMLDGLGLTTLKGALMSRGTREISHLINVMGGNELSVYGLCHLGDYEATLFSEFSHNRKFGEMFVQGQKYEQLSEGYYTVKAIKKLENKYGIELPICDSVYEILYNGKDPKVQLDKLFSRGIKNEF